MRWKTEQSIDGKLCQEYLYQKLSKSGNWFSSYSQKCWGCFFGTQCISNFLIMIPHSYGQTRSAHFLSGLKVGQYISIWHTGTFLAIWKALLSEKKIQVCFGSFLRFRQVVVDVCIDQWPNWRTACSFSSHFGSDLLLFFKLHLIFFSVDSQENN